jgi:hypothetical protein
MTSSIRRWLSYRATLRLSPTPIALALALALAATAGSVATWARAHPPPVSVPAGDPGDTTYLADALAVLCAKSYQASFPAEAPFLDGNASAMAKMMTGMTVIPSGDVDTDFVRMMVPHHRGAIDMAVLELRYGRNSILKRMAQEIIVDQQQEISAMDLAIREPLSAAAPAPTWNSAPLLTSADTP